MKAKIAFQFRNSGHKKIPEKPAQAPPLYEILLYSQLTANNSQLLLPPTKLPHSRHLRQLSWRIITTNPDSSSNSI
jgi:hypothetical protein